jgi:hypothetical protein
MRSNPVRIAAALVPLGFILGGCISGLPWSHRPDPDAAAALQQAEPMVAECRRHFLADLKGAAMRVDSGPTVVRDGTITTVRLDALPPDPTSDSGKIYSCEFDSGKLGVYGVVE